MDDKSKQILSSSIFACIGAFILLSLTEIFWGIFTPGDFFGNGHEALMLSSFAAALIAGGIFGYKSTGPAASKFFFLLLFLLFMGYWLFARDGWWVHPLIPRC